MVCGPIKKKKKKIISWSSPPPTVLKFNADRTAKGKAHLAGIDGALHEDKE